MLCRMSLLKREPGDVFSMHRLLQGAARQGRSPATAVRAVTGAFTGFDRVDWHTWPAARVALIHADAVERNSIEWVGTASFAEWCAIGGGGGCSAVFGGAGEWNGDRLDYAGLMSSAADVLSYAVQDKRGVRWRSTRRHWR
jgi:hypothetical protein